MKVAREFNDMRLQEAKAVLESVQKDPEISKLTGLLDILWESNYYWPEEDIEWLAICQQPSHIKYVMTYESVMKMFYSPTDTTAPWRKPITLKQLDTTADELGSLYRQSCLNALKLWLSDPVNGHISVKRIFTNFPRYDSVFVPTTAELLAAYSLSADDVGVDAEVIEQALQADRKSYYKTTLLSDAKSGQTQQIRYFLDQILAPNNVTLYELGLSKDALIASSTLRQQKIMVNSLLDADPVDVVALDELLGTDQEVWKAFGLNRDELVAKQTSHIIELVSRSKTLLLETHARSGEAQNIFRHLEKALSRAKKLGIPNSQLAMNAEDLKQMRRALTTFLAK